MGLDHCIHCAFHVLCPNMLHACVLCVVWNYIHGKKYMEKGEHGLEIITLGIWKKNEHDSSRY